MTKYIYKLITVIFILIMAVYVSLFYGGVSLHLSDLVQGNYAAVFDLRLTRVILALLAGAGLSLTGMVYQGVLLNPLAEPYLLGVSAGGALGAILAILLGGQIFVSAVIGSLLALSIVYIFARKKGHFDNTGMILSGVMVNAFCSALIMFIVTLAGTRVNSMMFWLMGDIGSGQIEYAGIIFLVLFLLIVVSAIFAKSIDALSLGEEQAMYLGIEVRNLKLILFVLASLLTAIIVASVGIIGFVGLVVPHVAKMLVSEHTAEALPFVIIIGAAFMVVADLISRVLIPDTILPVGIITALIGVPFFVLVYKRSV